MTNEINLHKEQQDIVNHIGDVLCLACPGSGKTRVLVQRAARLSKYLKSPRYVYLLTFTRKAANEMQERLRKLGVQRVIVGTIHKLAYRILRGINYYKKPFIIYDGEVPTIDNTYVDIEDVCALDEDIKKVVIDYKYVHINHLLKDFHEYLQRPSSQIFINTIAHVLVDEVQDTNKEQFEIILKLAHKKSLTLVGDINQCIYSFQNANPSYLSDFFGENGIRPIIMKKITKNFRNPPKVQKISKTLIKHKCTYKTRLYVTYCEAFLIRSYIDTYRKEGDSVVVLCRVRWYLDMIKSNFERFVDENDEPIEFMTCHESKGTEKDIVIIVGCYDRQFPHHKQHHSNEGIDEECRVLYVGLTRAKERVMFTSPRFVNMRPVEPSRFLSGNIKYC